MQRTIRCLSAALLFIGLLSACGGSHGSGPAAIPGLHSTQTNATLRAAAASTGDVVAINAGGGAAAAFAADADFVAAGTWTSTSASAIDTSTITSPAPQAVYHSQRVGAKISYSLSGLTPGAHLIPCA